MNEYLRVPPPHYVKPSAFPQTLLTVSGIVRSTMIETALPPAVVDKEYPLKNLSVNSFVKRLAASEVFSQLQSERIPNPLIFKPNAFL